MTGGWLPPDRTSSATAAGVHADAGSGVQLDHGHDALHREPDRHLDPLDEEDPFPPALRHRHRAHRRTTGPRNATAAGTLGVPVALIVAVVAAGLLVLLLGGRSDADGELLLAATTAATAAPPESTAPTGTPPAAGGPVASAPAPGEGPAPAPAPAPRQGAVAQQPGDSVTVHVAGAVLRPGLVELPAGARVADALEAAGGAGADADLARVNLARSLVDGEQVLVPLPGEVLAGAPVAAAPGPDLGAVGSSAAGGPVDLNTAGVEELDTLPGVGPVLAQRIVDWRTDVGPFASVADLTAVSGIGEALVAGLEGVATV